MDFKQTKDINDDPSSIVMSKTDFNFEFPCFTVFKRRNVQKQGGDLEEMKNLKNKVINNNSDDISEELKIYTENQLGIGLHGCYCETTFTLSILGNGEMNDQSETSWPWDGIRDKIKNLTIGCGTKKIGTWAFYNFTCLTSVSIQKNSILTNINDLSFYYCTKLTSIIIPSSVTNIGSETFSQCSSLTSIIIPSNMITLGIAAFHSCSSLTSIIIPPKVTNIEIETFYYCSKLASVTISNNITKIDSWAFEGCNLLTSVKYCGIKSPTYGENVFKDTPILSQSHLYPIQVHKNYKDTQFGGIVNLNPSLEISDCLNYPNPNLLDFTIFDCQIGKTRFSSIRKRIVGPDLKSLIVFNTIFLIVLIQNR